MGMCDVLRHFLSAVTLSVFSKVFVAQKTCDRMGRKRVFVGQVVGVPSTSGTGIRSRKMMFYRITEIESQKISFQNKT